MDLLEKYRTMLERKNRLIQEYIEEKNSMDGFKSFKRELEYYVLHAEITRIKGFVEDLEDLSITIRKNLGSHRN